MTPNPNSKVSSKLVIVVVCNTTSLPRFSNKHLLIISSSVVVV